MDLPAAATATSRRVGTDAAGRRQYLYHPVWRERRDREKFDRITAVASRLPGRPAAGRPRTWQREGTPLDKAAAAAVRLLDRGYFRIGSDTYTDENGSLRPHHPRAQPRPQGARHARLPVRRQVEHRAHDRDRRPGRHRGPRADAAAAHGEQAAPRLRDRTGGGADLTAPDVNAYLAELLGGDLTAKDFRTWHATVLAALSLAESEEPGDTVTSRRRAVKAAVAEVAEYLGNTPTIAKNSYVDPRVIDEYESGQTIDVDARRFRNPERRQAAAEKALLELLTA